MTDPAYKRLDRALTERGLARSRTYATTLIANGMVTVDGTAVLKASTPVAREQLIEVVSSDHYVSRAAHKLLAALDAFAVDVSGRLVLDVGASTGGFTQVLLERGARHVIALDVGHGQLAESIRSDPRITVVEGSNARYLTAEGLISESGVTQTPQLVVADLSFISLTTVLPALVDTVGTGADFVLLVKPQFEVGRTGIREGIVRQAALRDEAVMGVLWSAWDCGLPTADVIASPLAGSSGNNEYLLWLSVEHGCNPTQWRQRVSDITL
ncbi:MAG: TlyA family RNA methyltransferase [Rhodoglobus sp.]